MNAAVRMKKGTRKCIVSTSHHNGKGAYKKTWPAWHSKKPTLVISVYHFRRAE